MLTPSRHLILGLPALAHYLELAPAVLCAMIDEHELFPMPNPEMFARGTCVAIFRSDEVDRWRPVADMYAGRKARKRPRGNN